jgi:class 3 adenylate cyclase
MTNEDAISKIRGYENVATDRTDDALLLALGVFLGVAMLCAILAPLVGKPMARPLRRLSELMVRLRRLDFAHECGEFQELRTRRRSRFKEVCDLQGSFWKLSHAVEAFADFVPEAVVRQIVGGSRNAAQQSVEVREVTIMFCTFTPIGGHGKLWDQSDGRKGWTDYLYLLWRYLAVMSRVIEEYEGVVGEILDNGIVAFWNTPHDVDDHAGKACAAALAQQLAIAMLSEEFESFGMARMEGHIGIHTGEVYSGNIRAGVKMKFGCLGDPMNLSSRLMALCKHYGVGVICSGETLDALPADAGFFCRRLDLAQVKGRKEPTDLVEVIAMAPHDVEPEVRRCSTNKTQRATTPPTTVFATAWRRAAAACRLRQEAFLTKKIMALRRVMSGNGSWTRPALTGEAAATGMGHVLTGQSGATVVSTLTSRVMPSTDKTTPEHRARVERYEEALEAFQCAHFVTARDLLEKLLAEDPLDCAAELLLERTNQYIAPDGFSIANLTPEELENWRGINSMKSKTGGCP